MKVADIQPAHHCYNIYAKIIEAKVAERDGKKGKVSVVEGLLGDESATANFRLSGEHTTLIKEGEVVAVRNGLSNVISEHILLELDKFGRVTLENDHKMGEINQEKNISKFAYVPKQKAK